MNWLKNMKIRTRLMLSFIIIIIFTGVVGAIGISNMNTIKQRGTDMYEMNLVFSLDLEDIKSNLLLIRTNHALMLYDADTSKFQERYDAIQTLVTTNDNLLNQVKSGLVHDEEKALYNILLNDLQQYRSIRDSNIVMIQNGNLTVAKSQRDSINAAREIVDGHLDELITLNENYAAADNEANNKTFATQSAIMLTILVCCIGFALVLSYVISNMISKPLTSLVDVADKMANGDLDVEVDYYAEDEVGMLSNAFRRMSQHLNDVMMNITAAAEQVAAGSKQVSDSSMALSQGATEQASSIEQLTASLEEISSQTVHNAENANKANRLAEDAKSYAVLGNQQMKEMLASMNEINNSSSNISKIIKVIDDIAFQTNILALNAAVEAARAGQHGKGFAVVAEEVRNLAARSANAAKETTAMIEGSIKQVEEGTKIANLTADELNSIVNGIADVAALVGEIDAASNEQATAIAQINTGIAQVSDVIQTNSATSEESAAASEELSSQADKLNEMVSGFKLKKTQQSYYNNQDFDSNVLGMLDKLGKNKERNSNRSVNKIPSKIKISLDDKEFGKY